MPGEQARDCGRFGRSGCRRPSTRWLGSLWIGFRPTLDDETAGTQNPAVLAAASSVADRISLAEDALAEAGAELIPTRFGRVIRQAAFPHVYDANLVRRARLREETLDDALEDFAQPLRAVGARHLQLTLDGADVPETLRPLLRRRGF